MRSNLRIRQATRRDLPAITRLGSACLADLVGTLVEQFRGIVARRITWLLARFPHTCLVAYQAGRLVGFALAEYTDSDAFIVFLAVNPAYRRKRIGTAMVSETVRRLRQRGVRLVGLMTPESNEAAAAFWRRQGFQDAQMKVLTKTLP